MVEPASFEELDRAIGAVLDAETTNFLELAKTLGLNPKQDFAGADLSGVDLSGCDLPSANFAGANLERANLVSANLQGANLVSANLQGAVLTNTDLSFSNLGFTANLNLVRACADTLNSICTRILHLNRDLNFDLVLALKLALNLVHDLNRALDPGYTYDLDYHLDLNHDYDLVRILVRDLDRDLAHASNVVLYLDLNHTLNDNLALARERARELDYHLALARELDHNLAAIGLNCTCALADQLISCLTGPDFTSVNLVGAIVDGAIMRGCKGLSLDAIADLKRRGAIFDEPIHDRLVIDTPRPKVPR